MSSPGRQSLFASDNTGYLPNPLDSESLPSIVTPQHSCSYSSTPTTPHRHTVKSLLAAFGAQRSPTSVTKLRMAERELRERQTINYQESDDESSQPPSPSELDSPRAEQYEDNQYDDELGEDSPGKVAYSDYFEEQDWSTSMLLPDFDYNLPDRMTSTGRPLRPRSVLSGPAGSLGISYQISKAGNSSPRRKDAGKTTSLRAVTARKQVRSEIAAVTRAKADRFIYVNRDLFLPLLPAENYVRRLPLQNKGPTPYRDVPQPRGINATMKPYQLKGLSFLVHMYDNGFSAILGDEMGLGKTLQTLSLLQYLKDNEDIFTSSEARPSLIICPLTILENWVSEARKFTPELKVLRFHGSPSERDHLKDVAHNRMHSSRRKKATKSQSQASMLQSLAYNPVRYDIVITTYETFLAEVQWFKRAFVWRYLVLDEGQKIKNHKSDVSRALQGVGAEYRLLLTGTPLQNNLTELWSLFHWLLPDIFLDNSLPLFKNSFNLTKGKVDRTILDASRRLLELVMLRRMKSTPGVDLNLPAKEIIRLFVPLTPLQKKWYMRLLTLQSDDLLEEVFRGSQNKEQDTIQTMVKSTPHCGAVLPTKLPQGPLSQNGLDDLEVLDLESVGEQTLPKTTPKQWGRLLNLVMQLRKICTHPYLIPDAAPIVNRVGRHVIQASGKFMAMYKLIDELVMRKGKKILIFSTLTGPLEWTEDLIAYMSLRGEKFKHIRFDGSTPRARRNLHVRLFQQADSEYKIFLISTKAGGLGLNLTAATEAIFIDEDWNPQVDLQAEARCHRIGQTQPVTIYKLCTAGTVEEQMLGRINKKLYLSAKITETMQNIHDSPSINAPTNSQSNPDQAKTMFGDWSEFKSFLRRGTQTLANESADVEQLDSWDFDTMITNCRERSNITTTEDNEADEEKWLSTMEKVECAVFDGQRYAREKYHVEELEIPVSRAERRVGKNVTVMVGEFAVNKESLDCLDGEALPTRAGKDPSLQTPKRERVKIEHQGHCQTCFTGKEDHPDIIQCAHCPRIHHAHCLDPEVLVDMQRLNWSCPQHQCVECTKKASDAGGMIFRCRWCPNGYCEDCIEWSSTQLLGDTIDEYKVLQFPCKNEAYYIVCPRCNTKEVLEDMEFYAGIFRAGAADYEKGIPFDMAAIFADDGLSDVGEDEVVESIEKESGSSAPPATTMHAISAMQTTTTPTPLMTPGLTLTTQSTVEPLTPTTPQCISLAPNEIYQVPHIFSPPKRKVHEVDGHDVSPATPKRQMPTTKTSATRLTSLAPLLNSPSLHISTSAEREVQNVNGFQVSPTAPGRQVFNFSPTLSHHAPFTPVQNHSNPAPPRKISRHNGSPAMSEKEIVIVDLTEDSPPGSPKPAYPALRASTPLIYNVPSQQMSPRVPTPSFRGATRPMNFTGQVTSNGIMEPNEPIMVSTAAFRGIRRPMNLLGLAKRKLSEEDVDRAEGSVKE